MSSVKVLYEDNHIIAVVKPAGLLTQGDKSGEPSLMDEVKDYLKEKKGKKTPSNPSGQAGQVFLGLVHRLDKPVQGIVLFGKTSKGASRLSEQFRNHTIQKTYHAIVLGKMEKQSGELKEKINKISFFAQGFGEKSDKELLQEIKKATKTRTAELSWEAVRESKPFGAAQGKIFTLVKILPKTGRFHQIRVQMANMGHPILGDFKYSNQKPLADGSIALCASAIAFRTATENKVINLQIDLPKNWETLI